MTSLHLTAGPALLYAREGRPSIAPEKLLRALVVQMLYSIRSERLLMEEIDYNILLRWFVGLNLDEEVWDATTFTKNRERLLEADVAKQFLAAVVEMARAKGLVYVPRDRSTRALMDLVSTVAGNSGLDRKSRIASHPTASRVALTAGHRLD